VTHPVTLCCFEPPTADVFVGQTAPQIPLGLYDVATEILEPIDEVILDCGIYSKDRRRYSALKRVKVLPVGGSLLLTLSLLESPVSPKYQLPTYQLQVAVSQYVSVRISTYKHLGSA
jgi:hypothetical protein